jgi:hypothetical protein
MPPFQPNKLLETHDLAIQVVLLDHDNVDRFGVLEGEEAKATRAAGGAISHDSAFHHLTELREVVAKRLWRSMLALTS